MNDRDKLAFLPVFTIAFLNWGYNILILDRYKGIRKFRNIELYALFVSILGGCGAWISSMSIREENLVALQITSSVFRSFTSWFTLVIIVNEDFYLSKQQILSLVFRTFITVLWEIQNRLILSP